MREILVAVLLCALAPVARASPSLEHILAMSGEDAIFLDTDADVIVARVQRVEGGGTNGDPPRLALETLEVLRGGRQVDRRRAVWVPFPNDIDWVGGDADSLVARWEREPLAAAAVGGRFILAGDMIADSAGYRFEIPPLGRFPDDPARRAWVTSALERRPRFQAQQREYSAAWRRAIPGAELLDGARPVLPTTPLAPGEAVLLRWATLWQGRVVRTNPDGTVVVRPEGRDERWDSTVSRELLLLYPERLLAEQRTKNGASPR